ncbi:uncharacterized protein LOC111706542 [Eurytemora carolleeae]|uniref:uncharacterized protein LOC111706542 n=1 Tax=Eurytemora carolleeae TaxID=1294199 RepID=UPI000C76E951|nr:uncharacterized protein LOC111706542 [Eurytemora carolleeae]|eukprot:XP_023335206.1 uncharacterized protein LOC111706542 [Eurytemora affinis]
MSTFLFGSEENVRYLVNTISDGKEALYPFYRFPGNEGGISFINQETAKTKPANLIGEPVYPVTLKEILDSITTDTVIIKIDVEGSECVALTPYLTQPIKKKNIPYFLMEWTYIFQNIDDCCPGISTLIKGFLDSGYYAVEVTTLQRVNMTEPQNWDNILWVHNEAFRQF